MCSIGIYGLLSSITTASPSLQNNSNELNPRKFIRRYLFGLHAKTKRSLAEEAECGDEISILSWIKDGTDPNEVDAYGYTPLLNAAAIGRLCAIEKLIMNGADINKKGPFRFTPLHAAAQNGHREVVKLLVDNGAIIDSQNDDLDTPMHLAISTRQIDIVYLLLRSGCNVHLKGFMNKDCVETAQDSGLNELAHYIKNYTTCMKKHNVQCKHCQANNVKS